VLGPTQQVDEISRELQNGDCAAFAQAAVPQASRAIGGGGEWEMMRKEDSSLLLAEARKTHKDTDQPFCHGRWLTG
jgi:hypothetical protein